MAGKDAVKRKDSRPSTSSRTNRGNRSDKVLPFDEQFRCTATNRRGTRCERREVPGTTLCAYHGGRTPARRAKARQYAEAVANRTAEPSWPESYRQEWLRRFWLAEQRAEFSEHVHQEAKRLGVSRREARRIVTERDAQAHAAVAAEREAEAAAESRDPDSQARRQQVAQELREQYRWQIYGGHGERPRSEHFPDPKQPVATVVTTMPPSGQTEAVKDQDGDDEPEQTEAVKREDSEPLTAEDVRKERQQRHQEAVEAAARMAADEADDLPLGKVPDDMLPAPVPNPNGFGFDAERVRARRRQHWLFVRFVMGETSIPQQQLPAFNAWNEQRLDYAARCHGLQRNAYQAIEYDLGDDFGDRTLYA